MKRKMYRCKKNNIEYWIGADTPEEAVGIAEERYGVSKVYDTRGKIFSRRYMEINKELGEAL